MPYKPAIHRPSGKQTDRERKAEHDKSRLSSSKRGYNANWRRLRALVLSEEPLCRSCAKEGRTTAANEVDHITPHKGDRELFYARENLQSLCKSCHSRKTATEDSSFASDHSV